MKNLIPFESAKVPAVASSIFGAVANMFSAVASTGFPSVSIKSKVFTIVRGDERTLVTKPGEDDPAGSIEVVILNANPVKSKVYYAKGWVEGSEDKPACYSNNGVGPEADSAEPQAKKCATCPQNEWGSKITESGKKTRACSDSLRIAIAAPSSLNDPMMLRVPAMSLKALAEYGAEMARRGYHIQEGVTKIGFDYTVSHPQLTFKCVGLLAPDDVETRMAIKEMMDSDIVAQIIGVKAGAAASVEAPEQFEQAALPAPTPAPAPVAEKPKAAAKPKASALAGVVAAAETKPKAEVKVEAPAAVVVDEDDDLAAEIAAMGLDD